MINMAERLKIRYMMALCTSLLNTAHDQTPNVIAHKVRDQIPDVIVHNAQDRIPDVIAHKAGELYGAASSEINRCFHMIPLTLLFRLLRLVIDKRFAGNQI